MTTLRTFHVPATRPRPYSHDWEEEWTDVLLSAWGGVRGSGMSGEGEVFLSFTDLISCHQVEPDELGAVDWPSVVPSL